MKSVSNTYYYFTCFTGGWFVGDLLMMLIKLAA